MTSEQGELSASGVLAAGLYDRADPLSAQSPSIYQHSRSTS